MKNISLIILFFFTINCSLNNVSNTHGFRFLETKTNKIVINKTNKNDVKKLIQNAMVSVSSSEYHKFSIPLEVGVNSGNNWGEAH